MGKIVLVPKFENKTNLKKNNFFFQKKVLPEKLPKELLPVALFFRRSYRKNFNFVLPEEPSSREATERTSSRRRFFQ